MINSTKKIVACVPAAGIGRRLSADRPKQYLTIAGKMIIDHTLATLLAQPLIDHIVVVLAENDIYWQQSEHFQSPNITVCRGGKERMLSVINGLSLLSNLNYSDNFVCVHDVARCLLHPSDLLQLINNALTTQTGAILVNKITDTVKQTSANNPKLINTVPRESLWSAQTPQIFNVNRLLTALINAKNKNLVVTDEAQAMELMGEHYHLLEAQHHNFKVTTPQDLQMAQYFIENEQELADAT